MLFPDGIELDMVAGSLHNAAEIAPGLTVPALLRSWAELGLDLYTMMASQVLTALGRTVSDQLKHPGDAVGSRRARCKKIMTPLVGGARPDQLTVKPLEYFARRVAGRRSAAGHQNDDLR